MNGLVDNFTKYWHFKSGHKAEESRRINIYLDGYPQNSET